MDFYCPCGIDGGGHLDSDFAYYVKCPSCGSVFQMGHQVIAKRVDAVAEGHTPKVLS